MTDSPNAGILELFDLYGRDATMRALREAALDLGESPPFTLPQVADLPDAVFTRAGDMLEKGLVPR